MIWYGWMWCGAFMIKVCMQGLHQWSNRRGVSHRKLSCCEVDPKIVHISSTYQFIDTSDCCILIYRFMHIYTYICWIHTDAMNNRRAKTSVKKNIPLTLFVTFACERELGTKQRLQYIDPHSYGHQRCVFLVLLMLNRRPRGSAFCWVLAFPTTSSHQRVFKTTGGPEGSFCWVVAFLTTTCLRLLWPPTHWLPVSNELYNSSIAHSIAHSIFGMECLIVIKRK